MIYATYLSGSFGATPSALSVDSSGNVIVAGTTSSPDYPTTPDSYQPEYFPNPAPQDFVFDISPPPSSGYITKLNAAGSGLIWSSYLGGSGGQIGSSLVGDTITGMGIDSAGNILLCGFAYSPDIPGIANTPVASRPPVNPADGSNPMGFVARLSANGSTLSPTQLVSAFGFYVPQSPEIMAVAPDGSVVLAASPFVAGAPLLDVSLSAPGRVEDICDPADEAKVVTIAPGQLLTLYGPDLAPPDTGSLAGDPISLNGVTVTFNGIAAPILYAAFNQINLEVPYEIAGQTQVTMQVSSQSVTPPVSESYYLAVVPRQPSYFLAAATFSGTIFDLATCNSQSIAGIQPLALNADGSLNTCTNSAAPGSAVTVFLDGVGATLPAQSTGAISTSSVVISPAGALVPNSGALPTPLPTQTLAGLIADVAGVQVLAPSTTSVIHLEVFDPTAAYLVRGPGIIIWVGSH